jgi:hypothetical protein
VREERGRREELGRSGARERTAVSSAWRQGDGLGQQRRMEAARWRAKVAEQCGVEREGRWKGRGCGWCEVGWRRRVVAGG